jgi:hypothetical protein
MTSIIFRGDYRPTFRDIESLKDLANKSDEEALSVSWVRWVPELTIPVQRLITQYGSPEKKGFSEDDYTPYKEWTKKGITAFLTDDEKSVTRIDFLFTMEDQIAAYKAKNLPIPTWLKTTPTTTIKKTK